MKNSKNIIKILAALTILSACGKADVSNVVHREDMITYEASDIVFKDTTDLGRIIDHAMKQTEQDTKYDGSYVSIGYPGGDPGYQQGVCTDVVVRALRAADIDLQELIHRDMKKNLDVYKIRKRIKHVDKNIDHRRTQNIQSYLTRLDAGIKRPDNMSDYKPGDILFWDIANGHTGIVVKSKYDSRHLVVHNIGSGAKQEDLLTWEPVEVYRLTDEIIKKMQKDCNFKYDSAKDFVRHVQ